MTTQTAQLAALHRPKLLVRAARMALDGYRRDRDLRHILRRDTPAHSMLGALLVAEAQMEATRLTADGTYSALRHVSVLTALIAEGRRVGQTAETTTGIGASTAAAA